MVYVLENNVNMVNWNILYKIFAEKHPIYHKFQKGVLSALLRLDADIYLLQEVDLKNIVLNADLTSSYNELLDKYRVVGINVDSGSGITSKMVIAGLTTLYNKKKYRMVKLNPPPEIPNQRPYESKNGRYHIYASFGGYYTKARKKDRRGSPARPILLTKLENRITKSKLIVINCWLPHMVAQIERCYDYFIDLIREIIDNQYESGDGIIMAGDFNEWLKDKTSDKKIIKSKKKGWILMLVDNKHPTCCGIGGDSKDDDIVSRSNRLSYYKDLRHKCKCDITYSNLKVGVAKNGLSKGIRGSSVLSDEGWSDHFPTQTNFLRKSCNKNR